MKNEATTRRYHVTAWFPRPYGGTWSLNVDATDPKAAVELARAEFGAGEFPKDSHVEVRPVELDHGDHDSVAAGCRYIGNDMWGCGWPECGDDGEE